MAHCRCPDAVILPACRRKALATRRAVTVAIALAFLPAVLGMCFRHLVKAAGQLTLSTNLSFSWPGVLWYNVGVSRVVAGDVPMWGTAGQVASTVLPRSSFGVAVVVNPSNNETDAIITGGTDNNNLLSDSYLIPIGVC